MKKLWILVAAIAVLSCKEEAPVEYAVVSGTITNATAQELTLMSADRSFRKTITLSAEGTFTDTLTAKATTYNLYEGRNATAIYADHGDNINFTYDATDFTNTLQYSGVGFETSTYLVAKNAKTRELMGEGTAVYELEEADYKAKMNEIKSAIETLLDGTAGVSDAYKASEKNELFYDYIGKLERFPSYHAHYAKKPDFKASDDLLSEKASIDFNNEADYQTSQSYKSLVSGHYRGLAGELVDEKDMDYGLATLEVYQSISSELIKNDLAFGAAQGGMKYADDIDAYFNKYNAISTNDEHKSKVAEVYNSVKKVSAGQPSPRFEDFENHAGGTTSLEDLKGKYVYIDVWATWCGPCKYEIPFLKEVEEAYHGKNIHFLSLSIDDQKDHDKWVKMVTEDELGGIQLLGDKAWETQFVQDYLINGIPHFILLDPDLNVVKYSAPRPSNPELVELFDELGI